MKAELEVLDPRHDREPSYWSGLAERTGHPAAWSWEPLRIASWYRRSPLMLGVVHEDGEARGVVCSALRGTSWRPGAFAAPGRRPLQGILDVLLPLSSALPGWWLEPSEPRRRAEFLAVYRRGMRAELGWRGRGVLWREVGEGDPLPGPVKLACSTHPVAVLETPWADRDGWLGSLAPSRAADLRRQLRRVAADRTTIAAFGPARDLVGPDEIAVLKRENELKYGGASPGLPRACLAALVDREETYATAYRDPGGELLAFALLLDHPSWPVYLMWGARPPERGGRRHLYFAAIAEGVSFAAERGRRGLILGKGKASLKAELGAAFQPCRAVAVPF